LLGIRNSLYRDLLRSWRHDHAAVLCAFDLIEIDGKDLRRAPLEERKRALANVLRRERDGIVLNVHYDCDGATVFEHACKLGCEGIVSKRLGSPYRSGRVEHWLKIKNNLSTYPRLLAPSGWTDYGSGTGVGLVAINSDRANAGKLKGA
jgi:ATP-dependent DNA ligase